MTREELKIKLDKIGIPEYWYHLYGGTDILKTILDDGSIWRIYQIDERGNYYELATFPNESASCKYFYEMMKKEKERTDRINNMPLSFPLSAEKQRTFMVSEDGEILKMKRFGGEK